MEVVNSFVGGQDGPTLAVEDIRNPQRERTYLYRERFGF
jgi:hypothetical protein